MADPLLDLLNGGNAGAAQQLTPSPSADPLLALVGSSVPVSAGSAPTAAPQPKAPGFFSVDRFMSDLKATPGDLGNLAAGAVRGAGSIGATLLTPLDALARKFGIQNTDSAVPLTNGNLQWRDLIGRDDGSPTLSSLVTGQKAPNRRQMMDAGLQSLGADPNSVQYKVGKLGSEIAGTAGVPGALAKGVSAALPATPLVNSIVQGLGSGGFNVGGMTGLPGLAARVGTGAVTGGASAGLVDPAYAPAGAVIGGILPPAIQAAGNLGSLASDALDAGSRKLMQSAVKPTLAQLRSGDAATAIDTMLKNGISPNMRGFEKVQGLVDATDQRISNAIANSPATIDKANALGPVLQTRAQFGSQVDPTGDLQAIDNAVSGFLNHPTYPGMTLPVQDAQALKQGTYRILAKKYGQLGSADTEAQKALARGLKDEIANAVTGVGADNAQLSNLLSTLDVLERRALMEGNKNPVGLASLAKGPTGFLGFLADRSAALKALGARAMYATSPLPGSGFGLLNNPALLPVVRGGLLATEANP
jgi:hypothetical protein